MSAAKQAFADKIAELEAKNDLANQQVDALKLAWASLNAAPAPQPQPEPEPQPQPEPPSGTATQQSRFTTSRTANMNYRTANAASSFDSGSAVVENFTVAGAKETDLWIGLNEHDDDSNDDSTRFTYIAHVAKASGDSWQTAQKMVLAMPKPPSDGSDHGAPSIIWDRPRNRYLHVGTNHNRPFMEMATAPALTGPWTRTSIASQMNSAIRDDDPDASVFLYTYARPFVLADNNLYLTFRQGAVGGKRRIARSLDGGVTWRDAKVVLKGPRPYTWFQPHPDNRCLHMFVNKGGVNEHKGPGSNTGIYHLVLDPSNYNTLYEMDGTAAGWDRDGDTLGAGIVSRLQPYDMAGRVRSMVEDDGSTFGRPACVFVRNTEKLRNGSWVPSESTRSDIYWARWNAGRGAWDESLVAALTTPPGTLVELADIDPFNSNNVIYNDNGTLRKAVYNGSTWTKTTITTGIGAKGRPSFDHVRTTGPRVWARKSGGWELFTF